jgi:hypothetical protein
VIPVRAEARVAIALRYNIFVDERHNITQSIVKSGSQTNFREDERMSACVIFEDLTLGYNRHPAVHHLCGVIEKAGEIAVEGKPYTIVSVGSSGQTHGGE